MLSHALQSAKVRGMRLTKVMAGTAEKSSGKDSAAPKTCAISRKAMTHMECVSNAQQMVKHYVI